MKKSSAFHFRVIGLVCLWLLFLPRVTPSQELTKLPFPYGPLGLNSMPWVIAKEARLFEKNGLDVDMVYVGASAVIVQSMLSGSSNVAGFGGPAVVTNVLRGGDIIQVAAMAPYFTQSLFVRPDIRELRGIQGKKIGITRFGSVTDFALRTIIERHNLKDVNILQMRFSGSSSRPLEGSYRRSIILAAAQFSYAQRGFSRAGLAERPARLGQRLSHPGYRRAKILRRRTSRRHCAVDQIDRRGDPLCHRQ
jgi:ABC-type nitrate/sulfonate/bicarbonate transport system substrate-binding protein